MMEDLAMQMLEIIMNSVHADSREIEIRIVDSEAENLISMTVSDDGKGFDVESAQKMAGHYGLAGMRRRCADLGGEMEMKSTPGSWRRFSPSIRNWARA